MMLVVVVLILDSCQPAAVLHFLASSVDCCIVEGQRGPLGEVHLFQYTAVLEVVWSRLSTISIIGYGLFSRAT